MGLGTSGANHWLHRLWRLDHGASGGASSLLASPAPGYLRLLQDPLDTQEAQSLAVTLPSVTSARSSLGSGTCRLNWPESFRGVVGF